MGRIQIDRDQGADRASCEQLAFSPADAARKMSIGRTSLYKLIATKKLRTVKIFGRRLITLRAIQDCLPVRNRPSLLVREPRMLASEGDAA